ncbi:MAG TPA: alpha/beta hydrolase [Opitutaceae bacterium]
MTPHPVRFALALLSASLCLGAETPVNLWPGAAPGEKGDLPPEADVTKPTDPRTGGRYVTRYGNVSTPTFTLYRAAPDKNTGTTVVVFPGGGYYILAYDLEGSEICDWLNSIGVNAVLVKYRVPRRPGREGYAAPLQDAQRVIVTVRAHAKDWGIDPSRIGVLGFSAGGNLAATVSAASVLTYPKVDAADDLSFHPDFQVLIYPAYLTTSDNAKEGSYEVMPNVAVGASTPPTFMVMTEDDPIHVENVLGYAMALKKLNIPMELHVYPTGGHGYGMRPTKDFVTSWPERARDWMMSRGLLDPKSP